MKILLHVNNQDNWAAVLENTRNTINYKKEYDSNIEIEIVANGNAVLKLKNAADDDLSKSLNEIRDDVNIAACNNALKKFNIFPNELYDFVIVVPAGIIELAKRQSEGFAYIKP
ncbi:DsrE family protein [Desulfovibrio litoralis]|uniref:Uncharacterized protein n=1 Tax=Desulfovibrio litoralis DSM 11393 TaxID=1121455 RepID=A0A1M7RYZ6_9BACT|nr:DsrE family protein [Desulfovibrio litoralis]SHN51411.1 hypothetical protein SAMN02745728_00347 [Desulfovibrio litoralis DSM 11393]